MFICSNIIKNCINSNKKGFVIIKNKKNLNNLKIFIKLNIIKFIKIENNKLIVYINYINGKPIFKNIINLYKSSNKKFIKNKEIKKLLINKKYVFILSTNKGIITSYEAINLNVGGLILSQLWN